MRRVLAAAVSAAILFSISGCGGREIISDTDNSVTADNTSLQDSRLSDTESQVRKSLRAAVLSRNAARMWFLAGGEVIAAVEEAQDIPEISKDVPLVGTENAPSLEDVMEYDPDVIIADRTVEGYTSLRRNLSNMDCDILEVGANSFEEYDASMKLLTDFTGDTDAYRNYTADVAGRNQDIISSALEAAHKIKVTVTNIPDQSSPGDVKLSDEAEVRYYSGRVPTYMVMRICGDTCQAMSNDDYICSMLNDFGMSNANKSGQKVVIRRDPGPDSPEAEEGREGSSPAVSSGFGTEGGQNVPASSSDFGHADTFAEDTDNSGSGEAGKRRFENLLSNNPDFIFIVYEGNEKAAAACCRELVKSCDAWNSSFAVQSKRVYELPQASFRYQPDEKWDMAYEYLYQTIYNM